MNHAGKVFVPIFIGLSVGTPIVGLGPDGQSSDWVGNILVREVGKRLLQVL